MNGDRHEGSRHTRRRAAWFPLVCLLFLVVWSGSAAADSPADPLLSGAPPDVVRAVAGSRLLVADGDTAAALARLRSWLARHPADPHPAILAELGARLADRDSTAAALAAYREAARLAPDRPELWRAAGALAYRLGDAREAADALGRACRLPGPRDADLWRLTLSAAAQAADTALVDLAGDSLLARRPGDPADYRLAAGAWHAVGRDRRAAACLELLAAHGTLPVRDRLLLAGLYERLDVPLLAARWYRAALADTSAPELVVRLGLALADAGEDSAAIAAWEEGLREYSDGRLHLLLGDRLLRSGRCAEARPHLVAAAADPDSAVARPARELLAWLAGRRRGCQSSPAALY